MNITILGCGYVGLVSGACFAELGSHVTCLDIDQKKTQQLSQGIIPIYESGLDKIVGNNIQQGRLSFTTDLHSCIADADFIFLAVGTPTHQAGTGNADLSYLYQAVESIAPLLKNNTVIINKATVPVGTTKKIKEMIAKINKTARFNVASNPEFLKEGTAVTDFMKPDRIVIGVENEQTEQLLRELYRPLTLIESPILVTTIESAELIKYAANAFLATKIAFINEMAMLCEAVGADVQHVAKGIGLDQRIGYHFLQPGPGYGGSCFPKDTRALAALAREHDVPSRIVESVIESNETQKIRMIKKIRAALGGNEQDKTIAVLGLTFKQETDDMRDAPALTILPELIKNGCHVNAHDPQGLAQAKLLLPDEIDYYDDLAAMLEAGADALVLMTEWHQYRNLDLDVIKAKLTQAVFIDLRNIYDPPAMKLKGFDYHCIGR